jgi:hypothetical protein
MHRRYLIQITHTHSARETGVWTESVLVDAHSDIEAVDLGYTGLGLLRPRDRLIVRRRGEARTLAEWYMSSLGEAIRLL